MFYSSPSVRLCWQKSLEKFFTFFYIYVTFQYSDCSKLKCQCNLSTNTNHFFESFSAKTSSSSASIGIQSSCTISIAPFQLFTLVSADFCSDRLASGKTGFVNDRSHSLRDSDVGDHSQLLPFCLGRISWMHRTNSFEKTSSDRSDQTRIGIDSTGAESNATSPGLSNELLQFIATEIY